jgi:hypothetical protein
VSGVRRHREIGRREEAIALDALRGTHGSARRWLGVRGSIVGIALLVVGGLITWAVVSSGRDGSVARGVPTAMKAPDDGIEAETPVEEPPPGVGPFAATDLEGLVLAPGQGDGLVRGLEYSVSYSGYANLSSVHHWTLVPTEPLEAAGFVEGYSSIFMTSAFASTFAAEGRDLLTAALLFETPAGAQRAQRVFIDTRPEVWEEVRTLPMLGDSWVVGRLGSDNVSVTYPTVGFLARAGTVILLLGSQGGSERDRPLPIPVVREVARDLLARARAALEGAP